LKSIALGDFSCGTFLDRKEIEILIENCVNGRGVAVVLGCLLWTSAGTLSAQQQPRVSAGRVGEPILIDGNLDDPAWALAAPAQDFIQTEPRQGEPASERTEVRFLYDQENLYVGAHLFDSAGPAGLVVNDVTRDFESGDSDYFNVLLDTFNDNRNGFMFGTNPHGAKRDGQLGGDGAYPNFDWDGIWHVKVRITESGWQVEMAIPFKTLRFGEAPSQVWGLNFMRRIRRKNELVHWSPIPRPYIISRVSLAGELDGLEGVERGSNLYLKPYLSLPLLRRQDDDVDLQPEAGLDVKYGLGGSLTLDLTVNTDFAQVEADEQQINLTRFSLFFPEKREFFLENASIFEFGRSLQGFGSFRRDLIPFFSRRIGISEGQLVPILGGGRLTGRAGRYTLGILSLQADAIVEEPTTNFSVVRVRRDILRNSDVGGIFVNKQAAGGDFNRTFGADLNLNFLSKLDFTTFILKTETPGVEGKDTAADFGVRWNDRRMDIQGEFLSIGENFNAEVGFVPRRGFRKSRSNFTWRIRPEKRLSQVREIRPQANIAYFTDQENVLETRNSQLGLAFQLHDGSTIFLAYEDRFERLDEPFFIRPEQSIPVGDYPYSGWSFFFSSDKSRTVGGEIRVNTGEFFDGEKTSVRGELVLQPNYRFNAELSWNHDKVSLPSGDFDTDLVAARLSYSFNTATFLNALIQYDSTLHEISSNIRFNFIYKPLSDFFLVYNERRASTGEVRERALIAKLTYILEF
jgi:hypothetical protein